MTPIKIKTNPQVETLTEFLNIDKEPKEAFKLIVEKENALINKLLNISKSEENSEIAYIQSYSKFDLANDISDNFSVEELIVLAVLNILANARHKAESTMIKQHLRNMGILPKNDLDDILN